MPIVACTRCNGTGWDNAARASGMEDAPLMHRPLGVFKCNKCGGSGKTGYLRFDELPEEEREKQLEIFRKIVIG